MRAILPLLAYCTVGCVTASSAEELSVPNVIHKEARCGDPHGIEIYETAHILAPTGKFFDKDTVAAITDLGTRSYTDAAGPSGCFVQSFNWETVTAVTKSGRKVPISLLRGFDVHSHADCASGELNKHNVLGSISTFCGYKATVYDLPDFQYPGAIFD
jgi:hypothetical protein